MSRILPLYMLNIDGSCYYVRDTIENLILAKQRYIHGEVANGRKVEYITFDWIALRSTPMSEVQIVNFNAPKGA
jgi:hypothetical protein